MIEREKITIYCPRCSRRAFRIYEGCGMVISGKCEKCNKLVVFNPRHGVVLQDIPKRQDSSGSRFY